MIVWPRLRFSGKLFWGKITFFRAHKWWRFLGQICLYRQTNVEDCWAKIRVFGHIMFNNFWGKITFFGHINKIFGQIISQAHRCRAFLGTNKYCNYFLGRRKCYLEKEEWNSSYCHLTILSKIIFCIGIGFTRIKIPYFCQKNLGYFQTGGAAAP